jgi:DNA polymerase III subunit delta
MTAEQFIAGLRAGRPVPVCLFLGPEPYQRDRARRALIETVLTPEDREEGFVRHDLEEISLAEVLDDARSLSLFSPKRLILASRAEAVLPRGKAAAASDDDSTPAGSSADLLAAYIANPTPGVTLLFDAARYEFEGEDKTKIERVRKFFAAVPAVVEFPRLDARAATTLAQELARQAALPIGRDALQFLVEALGADVSRIAAEIEKLRLFASGRDKITVEDIIEMVPDARASNIFALVNALASGDRARSLDVLDTLVRQGEYLPLALAFLATQFRLALVAREAGLRNAQQIQSHFSSSGTPMWRSRAEQVQQTVAAFSQAQLEAGLRAIFETDRNLRDARPDDRVIVEDFIFRLTARKRTSAPSPRA